MACSNLTAGITLDCNDSNGSIEKVFIANGAVEAITETAGVITAITVGGSALTPSDFFEFEVPRQTSSLVDTYTISQENGTAVFDQQLTLYFNKMDADKRNQILLMAEATSMVIVAKDANGKYWSVGIEKGGYMVSGSSLTGATYADRNGYELVIGGMENKPCFEVTSTIVEA